MKPTYFQTCAATDFDSLAFPKAPFATLVIDPKIQSPDTQFALCHALVDAGCTHLAAWGAKSTQWDDSGDYAALLHRDGSLRQEDYDLLTWWCDDEPLDQAIAFFLDPLHYASHPNIDFVVVEFGSEHKNTVLALFENLAPDAM